MSWTVEAALAQLPYRNSVPRPGETQYEFSMRKQREFDQERMDAFSLAQAIQDQERLADLQNQYESALRQRGLLGGAPAAGGGGGWTDQAELDRQRMERERERTFAELAYERDFYRSDPTAQQTRASIMSQMAGHDVPFTQAVQDGLIGRETDAEAMQLAREQELIRQQMANSGIGGSGLQASALINAQREASRRSRAASREIRTMAELENFQARERARSNAQQLIAQESAARWKPVEKAADLRSQFEITRQEGENVQNFSDAIRSLGGGGLSAPRATLPLGYQGRATGNKPQSSYGGVTYLNGAGVSPFRQSSGGTGYPQMGLGGAAGPFGAVAQAGAIADRNMARRNDTGWSGWSGSSTGAPSGVPSFGMAAGAAGLAGQWGNHAQQANSAWDAMAKAGDVFAQNQANAVSGSATRRGSREEFLARSSKPWAWM